jgi:hypothetical protein
MQNAILYAGSAVVKTVQQLSSWAGYNRQLFIKGFITMKLLLLLIIASCLQAGATGYAQTINLSLKDAKLEKVFKEIEKQSNYRFVYTREQLESTKSLTVDVKNASIQTVLDICFKEQPVTYTMEELYVIVKRKDINKATEMSGIPHLIISGKVVDEEGYPIPGATISLRGSSIAIASDDKGE